MQIGYVGLGAMGGALARRLVRTQALCVWDINKEAVARLEELGASSATSAAEVARRCDVIMTCLPRSSDVLTAVFSPGGFAEGLSEGKVLIDQTSGNPDETVEMARRLSESGVTMLDAPVSGGAAGADAGTIAIMVSGPKNAYDRVLPVLNSISPNVDYCGERVGNAHALKLVNNTMSAAIRIATLEIVAMGRKKGLSLESMIDAINAGPGRSRTSKAMLPALLAGRRPLGDFAMALLLKDLNLAMSLGMKLGVPMSIANLVRSFHQFGINTLGEKAQLEEIVGLIESMAGTRFVDTTASCVAPREPTAVDRMVKLIGTAVAVCNRLITYECAMLAVKYGLPLDVVSNVINKGGAWNGAAEEILPTLSAGGRTTDEQLGSMAKEMQLASEVAIGCGAPILVADAVRSLIEFGVNEIGATASLDAISQLFETMADVKFATA